MIAVTKVLVNQMANVHAIKIGQEMIALLKKKMKKKKKVLHQIVDKIMLVVIMVNARMENVIVMMVLQELGVNKN